MPKKTQSYERDPLPQVQCCFAMCQTRATMRIRTKTGWANVCPEHDIELHNREAKDWLRENGLERQPGESMREWTSRALAHVRRGRKPIPRVANVADLLPAIPPPALPDEPPHIDFAPWDEAPVGEMELG